MSVEEREAFLAGVHVGVLSIADGAARAPLTVPVWYRYEPGGDVVFITGEHSRKMRLIRERGRCSLCVQTEDPPYKYVTVEGPVTAIDRAALERERRPIAVRYLGAERAEAYLASTAAEDEDSTVVRMRPEHWLSTDYGKLRV
jgi:PPOX class probable F420-dependent enzyme